MGLRCWAHRDLARGSDERIRFFYRHPHNCGEHHQCNEGNSPEETEASKVCVHFGIVVNSSPSTPDNAVAFISGKAIQPTWSGCWRIGARPLKDW